MTPKQAGAAKRILSHFTKVALIIKDKKRIQYEKDVNVNVDDVIWCKLFWILQG
jgi:hypothetical protein